MGGGLSSQSSGFKSEGDDCFRIGQYAEAIYWYTRSLSEEVSVLNDKVLEAAVYSNRSAAYEAHGQSHTALNDALKVIELRPDWTKGYYRLFRAQMSLHQLSDAKQTLCTIVALAPDDKKMILELETQLRMYETQSGTASNAEPSKGGISWVYSWGSNSSSQLGLGGGNDKAIPTMVRGFFKKYILSVACGAMHNVAISSAGETYTWGSNSYNQLGLPTSIPLLDSDLLTGAVPFLIPKLIGICITAVACGAGHSVVISSDGQVYTWGVGKQGQLGLGSHENVQEPVIVMSLQKKTVTAVSCGISHTFYLMENNDVFSTGSNNFGQLGLESYQSVAAARRTSSGSLVHTPSLVPLDPEVRVMHIACGGAHTLILLENGAVLSCGSNSCGQLGLGEGIWDDIGCFTQLPHFNTSSDKLKCAFVACGEEFSTCVTASRSVYAWGLGLVGQLGSGALASSPMPLLVAGVEGKGVEQVCCSQGQVLAVTAEAEVWTWGLAGDQAHLAQLDQNIIMKTPQRVAAFRKKAKIHQLQCGRKHYVLLTVGPYGPNCVVTRGLAADGEITKVVAGGRLAFQIQSRDFHNDVCDSGCCLFDSRLEHECLDYEVKFKLQMGSSSQAGGGSPGSLPTVLFDDNLDGTYCGQTRLYLTGEYRLSVSLCKEQIADSPFRICVTPGSVHGPSCRVWWGRFLSSAQPGLVTLECKLGDSILFTVSCRDKFGNYLFGPSTSSTAEQEEENAFDVSHVCGEYRSLEPDTSTSAPARTFKWREAKRGVFTCLLPAPSVPGKYSLQLGLDGSYSGDLALSGSPFRLIVKTNVGPAETTETFVESVLVETEEPEVQRQDEASGGSEKVRELAALARKQMTHKRAEDALRREQAKLLQAKEERRRRNAVKRTGGGFVIQYSKDV